MKVVEQIDQLKNWIAERRTNKQNAMIGFVPTMGALHKGHLSLIEEAKNTTDFVVCSIFVNPTQFNDSDDLTNYPRTIEADIEKLITAGCDLLFLPEATEIYPNGREEYHIDLGGLDEVMEGKFRENHFDGVAMVVERFFDIIKPNKAFFGLKDFQQVAVIKRMVEIKGINIEIVPAPIVRDERGLALSSRNELLTKEERSDALIISQTLQYGKELLIEYKSASELKMHLIEHFKLGKLKLEYLEIVDNDTLKEVDQVRPGISCCIAAYCGKIRLIDNMQYL